MQDAISGTEAIRGWDDHCIGIDNLAVKFNTNKLNGLSE
jgi:hypothetical protein